MKHLLFVSYIEKNVFCSLNMCTIKCATYIDGLCAHIYLSIYSDLKFANSYPLKYWLLNKCVVEIGLLTKC